MAVPDPRAKPTLSVPEAAELMGLHRATAYRLARAGTFPVPVIHLGRAIRVPTVAVLRLLELPVRDTEPPAQPAARLKVVDRRREAS